MKHDHHDCDRDTQLVYLGRDPKRDCGSVNPPVHRTSTVIFSDYAAFRDYNAGKLPDFVSYGRYGSPTISGFEEALIALEGADHAITTSSGLAAITTALLAFLASGDHALFPDSIYGSAREFIEEELVRLGVEVQFYDPTLGAGIKALMKPNTKVVYCESPGSLTFEMQDIPAIAEVAHAAGAIVMADNTWATPILQKPFALGIDISIHSASKYIGGHSDLIMGITLCKQPHAKRLDRMHRNLGACTSGDTAYLALRGLRTIAVRLKEHEAHAIEVANWLSAVPEVKRVRFPALPQDPGHALWKRDMSGACGLFAIDLYDATDEALSALIDGLKHFGVGFSWGGYESLITAYKPHRLRSVTPWDKNLTMLRLHIGLEDPRDLIADLNAGFERYRKTLKNKN